MYAVYRVTKAGKEIFLPGSCTENLKLAQEIAEERSRGEITTPTGKVIKTTPRKHIVKEV